MAPKTNIVPAITSFVGRKDELAELTERVRKGRLVTIVGPAGTGKTRVALEWAAAGPEPFARSGGIWFVDLSESADVESICSAVAGVLEIPLGSAPSPQRIAEALATRGTTVLVLDNFEQALPHAEATLAVWLGTAVELSIVITSREPLKLPDEAVLELSPLDVAGPNGHSENSQAVQLFVSRARSLRSTYDPSPEMRAVVADIVSRLDGLPLAIELAAARMRAMGERQIAQQLDRQLDLLASTAPDASRRAATMRGALDCSWELLEAWERQAFVRFSVFRGGFDLEAAEALLGDTADRPAFDVVQALIDRSLVHVSEDPIDPGQLRYGQYEAVRDYGIERRRDLGLDEEARRLHAEHYRSVARHLARRVRDTSDAGAVKGLAREAANVARALEWSLETDHTGHAIEFALALDQLYRKRGPTARRVDALSTIVGTVESRGVSGTAVVLARLALGAALLESGATAAAREQRERAKAEAGDDVRLLGRCEAALARQSWHEGKLEEAATGFERAIELLVQAGDRRLEGRALFCLANVHHLRGSTDTARTEYEHALDLLRAAGDRQHEALTLTNLASLDHDVGRLDEARRKGETALRILREIDDHLHEGSLLCNLGIVALERGDLEDARNQLREGLARARSVGSPRWEAMATSYLGLIEETTGRADDAQRHYAEALTRHAQLNNAYFEGLTLCWSGRLHADAGRVEEASRAVDRGAAVLRSIGDNILVAVASLCAAHVSLAKARTAATADERASRCREAGRALVSAKTPSDGGSAPTDRSSEVRLAYSTLQRALEATVDTTGAQRPTLPPPPERASLSVGPDGRFIELPDGTRQDLSTRRAMRLLVDALARHHEEQRGRCLDVSAMLEAGWPGERVQADAGATRVYTAVAALRRLGLRDYLVRRDEGYLLDPEVDVRRVD